MSIICTPHNKKGLSSTQPRLASHLGLRFDSDDTNTCSMPKATQYVIKWLASQEVIDMVDIGSISRMHLQKAAYHGILSPCPSLRGGQNANYGRGQNVERRRGFQATRIVSGFDFAQIAPRYLNWLQPRGYMAGQAVGAGQVSRRADKPTTAQQRAIREEETAQGTDSGKLAVTRYHFSAATRLTPANWNLSGANRCQSLLHVHYSRFSSRIATICQTKQRYDRHGVASEVYL